MAAVIASGVSMLTKANPRGRPLSRSIGRKTSVTPPNWAKRSRRSTSVALKGRFPTYIFVFISVITEWSLNFDQPEPSPTKHSPDELLDLTLKQVDAAKVLQRRAAIASVILDFGKPFFEAFGGGLALFEKNILKLFVQSGLQFCSSRLSPMAESRLGMERWRQNLSFSGEGDS